MADRIIAFVEKNFKEHIYEQLRQSNQAFAQKNNCFDSYKQFFDHNKKIVENLNCGDIEFLLKLTEEITDGHILQADSEHFIGRKTITFYFDKMGKLILINN